MRNPHRQLQMHSLVTVVCCLIASQASAADPSDSFRTHYGTTDMDMMGLAFATLGDLDSDGFNDYAVSAPGWSFAAGRVLVYSAQSGSELYTFGGSGNVAGLTGFSVANAGDVDNDGTDDIVIGAPTESAGNVSIGMVQIRSGATGSVLHSIYGAVADGCFGWSVAGAGDVNGDGYADFAVASPFGGSGMVEVFSGLSGTMLRQIVAYISSSEFGRSIANAGDTNGDGFDDLLIGSPKSNRAFIYDAHNDTIILSFVGAHGSQFGRAVANIGDVSGDGVNDMLVGAPGIGEAFVYDGDDGMLIYTVGGIAADHFGRSVGAVPDFNGDGTPDFIVGSPSDEGRAEVFSGATGMRIWIVSAAEIGDFGFAVGGIGDITGDGLGEVMVGHPALLHQGAAGATYFFALSAMPFSLGNPYSYNVSANNVITLKSADMNLDGFDDLVMLASNQLSIQKYMGNGAFLTSSLNLQSGATAMATGDINSDGRPDVVVTSSTAPRIKVYRNTSLGLVFNGTLGGVLMPTAATMADFNNDGRVDLAVTDASNSKVRIWLGNATGGSMLADYLTIAGAKPVGANPIQIEAVHLNADGYLDLAVLNKNDKTVSILSNKADNTFSLRPPVALEGTPYGMTFADFDVDGNLDLAVVVANSSKASIRAGNSGFTFNEPTFYNVGAGPRAVYAYDLNSDAKLDLITANWSQEEVSVRLGQPDGFAAPIKKKTAAGPCALTAFDLHSDGDVDLATLNKTSRSISIVPNLMLE